MSCSLDVVCLFQNMKENPIHIINVSIKQADTEDDDALVSAFTTFAQSKVRFLNIAQQYLYLCVLFCNFALFVF